jgi:hypothetical protein
VNPEVLMGLIEFCLTAVGFLVMGFAMGQGVEVVDFNIWAAITALSTLGLVAAAFIFRNDFKKNYQHQIEMEAVQFISDSEAVKVSEAINTNIVDLRLNLLNMIGAKSSHDYPQIEYEKLKDVIRNYCGNAGKLRRIGIKLAIIKSMPGVGSIYKSYIHTFDAISKDCYDVILELRHTTDQKSKDEFYDEFHQANSSPASNSILKDKISFFLEDDNKSQLTPKLVIACRDIRDISLKILSNDL